MLPAASSSLRAASFSSRRMSLASLFELLLQVGDLRVHRVLALAERLRLRLPAGAGLRLIERVHVGRDFLLLVGELFGLFLRALQIALAAPALVAFELLLRLAQAVERLVGLRAAVLRSVRRRAAHRVGRVLQLLHRVVQLLPLLLIARELFSCRAAFSASSASARCDALDPPDAALARLRHPPLPLHFLLLPPRQLLQLLDQLIDLLVALPAARRAAASGTGSRACRARARTDRRGLRPARCWPPPPPPPPCCCATCSSYCCSASCSSFSARCSGDSALSAFIAFSSTRRPSSPRRPSAAPRRSC